MKRGYAITLANVISLVLSAPSIAGVASIAFAFTFPNDLGPMIGPLQAAIIGVLTLAVLPVIPIFYYRRKGVVDLYVSDRKKRPSLFLFAIMCYALGAMMFKITQSRMMLKLALAYFFVSLSIMAITLFWKISVHAAGIAGPSTMFILVYGLNLLPIYLLTAVSIWARTIVKAHTLLQAITGAAAAALVTTVVYIVIP